MGAKTPLDEAGRDDAVRYLSVPAGSQRPTRTDSHGQRPRNTLTSTNPKADLSSGPGRCRATGTPKSPNGTMPAADSTIRVVPHPARPGPKLPGEGFTADGGEDLS